MQTVTSIRLVLSVFGASLCAMACGGGDDAVDSGGLDAQVQDQVPGGDTGAEVPDDQVGGLDRADEESSVLPDGRVPDDVSAPDWADAVLPDALQDAATDGALDTAIQEAQDSGPTPDLHPDDVAGDTGDQDAPPDVIWTLSVEVASPSQWQRGPVVVDYEVTGAGKSTWSPVVVWKEAGTDSMPCSPLAGYGEPLAPQKGDGKHRFVWDSMADAPGFHETVWLEVRIIPDSGKQVEAVTEQLGLYNEPDAVRQVLVTSSINGNNKVRRYTWTQGQGMSPEQQLLKVNPYPVRVAMAPNGFVAALVEENSESISLLHLNGETGVTSVAGSIAMADLYPVDVVFSGDGATLFVACASPDADGGIYRVDLAPTNGLPVPNSKPKQIHSQFQVEAVDLLPQGKGLAVLGPDPTMNMAGLHLATIDFSGKLLDTYDLASDGALPRSIAVSPTGSSMLVSWANLFGNGEGVALVGLSAAGVMTYLDEVTAEDPEEAVFGASGDRGIVSEAFGNKVTGLAVTPSSLERTNSVKMGLPTRLARTTWGLDSNTFLIATISSQTGVSSLAAVVVGPTGSLTLDKLYGMGNGNDVIPQDLAIQP